MKMNNYLWTDDTTGSMNLAFNKKLADSRKEWLYKYDESIILDSKDTSIPIETFINKEINSFL